MPRKGLKVVVDLNIQAVTCPGTVLRNREDVYLSVHFLGQQKRTLCLPPVFPLLFHQLLRYERTFPHCLDPAHLSYILSDENILIELIQLNNVDYCQEGSVLAFYETSAREFLYPEESLAPSYTDSERNVLMQRTRWFSGISPKLEFCCSTTVSDVATPTAVRYSELVSQMTDEDDEDEIITIKPSRRSGRRRTKSYEVATASSRSRFPSPRLSSTRMEERPPFIMKRTDTHNRALSPAHQKASLSPVRPMSAPPTYTRATSKVDNKRINKNGLKLGVYISERDCKICSVYRKYVGRRYWGHKKYYHPNYGIKLKHNSTNGNLDTEADKWLRSQIARELSDDTEELVENMTHLSFTTPSPEPIAGAEVKYGRLPYSPRSPRSPSSQLGSPRTTSPRLRSPRLRSPRSHSPRLCATRSRSPSPILLRSSLRDRYGDPSYSPRVSDRIHHRVVRALDNDFISSESSDVSSVTSEEAMAELKSTLRNRGYSDTLLTRSLLTPDRSISAHIDEGHHLSTRSYELTGQSHRDLFEDNVSRIYQRLYKNIKSTP